MIGVDWKAIVTFKKPDVGKKYPKLYLQTSDEFDEPALGMQWGWNHNPDSAKWSLTERKGFLRLKTSGLTSNLVMARNTLTQRPFAKRNQEMATTATIKMDIDHMKDGDIAGLAVFQDPYAYIGVKQMHGRKYIIMVNDGKTVDSAFTHTSTIYLRTEANNATKKATFGYSTENSVFKPLGDALNMRFNLKIFTGNKFCVFNYATEKNGGRVDIDWFRTE